MTIVLSGSIGIRKGRINSREDEALFGYFAFIDDRLRAPDIRSHTRRPGLSESHPAMPVSPSPTCLVAPICHREERVETVFLAEKEAGRAFMAEDEETPAMFAAQSAAAQDDKREVGWDSGIE